MLGKFCRKNGGLGGELGNFKLENLEGAAGLQMSLKREEVVWRQGFSFHVRGGGMVGGVLQAEKKKTRGNRYNCPLPSLGGGRGHPGRQKGGEGGEGYYPRGGEIICIGRPSPKVFWRVSRSQNKPKRIRKKKKKKKKKRLIETQGNLPVFFQILLWEGGDQDRDCRAPY